MYKVLLIHAHRKSDETANEQTPVFNVGTPTICYLLSTKKQTKLEVLGPEILPVCVYFGKVRGICHGDQNSMSTPPHLVIVTENHVVKKRRNYCTIDLV